jgi:hypothetical protein
MAVLLDHRTFGRDVAAGKVTVLVNPRSFARAGGRITSSGSMPSCSRRILRKRSRRSDFSHAQILPNVWPVTVSTLVSSTPSCAQVQHDFRHAAGQEDAHRRMMRWAVRQHIHEPRHTAIDLNPIFHGGPSQPAACAIAGMCSSKFVEPPNAACNTIALRIARIRQNIAHLEPRRSRPTQRPRRTRAISSQTGSPEGASALCGSAMPSASATTCEVAAVPRN